MASLQSSHVMSGQVTANDSGQRLTMIRCVVEWQPQTESTEARVAPEMPYITYHVKVKVPLFQLQLRPEVALFECYTGYTQIPFGRTLVAAMAHRAVQVKLRWLVKSSIARTCYINAVSKFHKTLPTIVC